MAAAVASLQRNAPGSPITVVHNYAGPASDIEGVQSIYPGRDLGVPGGRSLAVAASDSELIGFLDDDAELIDVDPHLDIRSRFDRDDRLGALSLRLVDENGTTSQRHVPRVGRSDAGRGGPVATFLGGACVLRRNAYEAAGGYWPELRYAHEELDLSWRMLDAGYLAEYCPEIRVFHPATEISRHATGWYLTGRNRVMIARRNLPWVIAAAHVSTWWLAGQFKAPDRGCRSSFRRGWLDGWRQPVTRSPIRWATAIRLARLGRPPLI